MSDRCCTPPISLPELASARLLITAASTNSAVQCYNCDVAPSIIPEVLRYPVAADARHWPGAGSPIQRIVLVHAIHVAENGCSNNAATATDCSALAAAADTQPAAVSTSSRVVFATPAASEYRSTPGSSWQWPLNTTRRWQQGCGL